MIKVDHMVNFLLIKKGRVTLGLING